MNQLLSISILVLLFGDPVKANAVPLDIRVQSVVELDISEISNVHLFHAGVLWVGQSYLGEGSENRIEIYRATSRLASVSLPHSLDSIQVFSKDSVLITGRTKPPPMWLTHYSVLTLKDNVISRSTYTMPNEYQVTGFLNHGSKMFFSQIDNALLEFPSFRAVGRPISFPGEMISVGESLFVVERSLNSALTHLVKLNPQTGEKSRTHDRWRLWITKILYLPKLDLVVASETGDDQLLWVDAKTNKQVGASTLDTPRGLAQFGNCLFVSSQGSRSLWVFDISSRLPTLIKSWDLAFVGPKLGNTKIISMDAASERLYVRGLNPSGRGNGDTSQSMVAQVEFDPTFLNRCREARAN